MANTRVHTQSDKAVVVHGDGARLLSQRGLQKSGRNDRQWALWFQHSAVQETQRSAYDKLLIKTTEMRFHLRLSRPSADQRKLVQTSENTELLTSTLETEERNRKEKEKNKESN